MDTTTHSISAMPSTAEQADMTVATGVTTALKHWQVDAVNEIVAHCEANRGCILHGGLGSGKTRISLRAVLEMGKTRAQSATIHTEQDSESSQTFKTPSDAPLAALIVTPASITDQWIYEEAAKEGVPPCLIMDYSGTVSKRSKRFDAWMNDGQSGLLDGSPIDRVSMDAAICEYGVVFCVVSYDMLHKDLDTSKNPSSDLFRKWDIVMFDEAHKFRNGVSRTARSELGKTLVTYECIDKRLMRHFSPLIVAISATPVINHQMDVYSLLRWAKVDTQKINKFAWTDTTSANFRNSIKEFRKNHLVNIKVPPIPPITMHDPKLRRSPFELERHKHFYTELMKQTVELTCVLAESMSKPTVDMRIRVQHQRNLWLASVTRASMEELWPGCYTFHQLDSENPSRITYSHVNIDIANSAPLPSLNTCSKLKWVVEMARQLDALSQSDIQQSRVVVFCQYVTPLVLLRRFLRQYVPDLPVFEHFGSLTRDQKNASIKQFFDTQRGGILLATRSSMGVGKNLECSQRVILLDSDWSKALENQALGRIQRPLVQDTHVWNAYRPMFDDPVVPGAQSFCIQKWMKVVTDMKDQSSASVLTEGAEDITDDIEQEAQFDSEDADHADKVDDVNHADEDSANVTPIKRSAHDTNPSSKQETLNTLTELKTMLSLAVISPERMPSRKRKLDKSDRVTRITKKRS